jgi:hypothetical protein
MCELGMGKQFVVKSCIAFRKPNKSSPKMNKTIQLAEEEILCYRKVMNKFSVKRATKISADKTVVGMAAKKLRKENTECPDELLPMPVKEKDLLDLNIQLSIDNSACIACICEFLCVQNFD